MTELCFADDAAIVAATNDSINEATIKYRVVQACGLTYSGSLRPNYWLPILDLIYIGDSAIEPLSSFQYVARVCDRLPW